MCKQSERVAKQIRYPLLFCAFREHFAGQLSSKIRICGVFRNCSGKAAGTRFEGAFTDLSHGWPVRLAGRRRMY